jgi:hypothetical protein
MNGIWSAIIVLITAVSAERGKWVEPVPGGRAEPSRPVLRVEDFGPESPYRLLLTAGKLPEACDTMAAVDWLQAAEKGRWDAATTARVRLVLAATEPNLARARRVATMPDARVPTMVSFRTLDQAPQSLRNLRRALALSAYYKEQTGDIAGAFADLLTTLRLSNMLTRGGGTIHWSTSTLAASIVVSDLWAIASRNRVPSPLLRRVSAELLVVCQQRDSSAEAIRNQLPYTLAWSDMYWHPQRMADYFQADIGQVRRYCLMRLGITLAAGRTPAQMRRDMAAFTARLASWAEAPYRPAIAERLRTLKRLAERYPCATMHLQPVDPWGVAQVAASALLFPNIVRSHAEETALLRGTALFLAVRAYEADRGRPPARLNALVPAYLPKLPKDPFTGKSFRYVVGRTPHYWGGVRWGIYSVGVNCRDDGGRATDVACAMRQHPVDLKDRWNPDIIWIPKPLP